MKNFKDLLDNLNSHTFSKINCILIFDFSTLYTTIPDEKFNTSLKEIIHNAFYLKNGRQHYKFIVLGQKLTYCI